MEKLKYAGICAAGFLLNCVIVGFFLWIYLGIHKLNIIDYSTGYVFYAFTGIMATVTAGALHGFFRLEIRKKLQMKTVVYTLLANVLPLIIGIVIRILILTSVIHTYGMYDRLEWILKSHFLSVEMFISGALGFVLPNNFSEKYEQIL